MLMTIVEDNDDTVEDLKKYIRKYVAELGITVRINRFVTAESFLENYEDSTDIVFMDIELPGMDGMECVRRLREKDKKVVVVFVTSLAQYAVNGYEVNAFDFMVKPITYGNFALKLRRIFQYLNTQRKCDICVSTRHGKTMIDVSTLMYVEIMKHVITFHTEKGNIVGNGTLTGIMDLLEGLPFALCNRCYLVNLQYVREISGNEVRVGDDFLQISKPRKKEFLQRFNNYLSVGGNVK